MRLRNECARARSIGGSISVAIAISTSTDTSDISGAYMTMRAQPTSNNRLRQRQRLRQQQQQQQHLLHLQPLSQPQLCPASVSVSGSTWHCSWTRSQLEHFVRVMLGHADKNVLAMELLKAAPQGAAAQRVWSSSSSFDKK